MKSITSASNPLFRQFKKLAGSARERRKAGFTLLDGMHLVSAYLETGAIPEFALVNAALAANPQIAALLEKIPQQRMASLMPGLFGELSPVENPTGIIAIIGIPRASLPAKPEFCMFIENVQDPGNLGSILRSGAAAGVGLACLSEGCADAWSPKVLRGGMGAHFVLAVEERADLLQRAADFDGLVVATSPQADRTIYELDLRGPAAFCIGNEGAGVTTELAQAADELVSIPMPGAVESLNAGAAAAVCLFERVRQLRLPGK